MGNFRSVGMADANPVFLQVTAQFSHLAEQEVDGLGPALGGADGNHLAFLAHVDEGTHPNQGAHGGGKASYTAAAAEELEVIGKEIHGEMVYLHGGPGQDFVQGLAGLHQVSHLAHDGVADGSDALGVNLFETGGRVLLPQLGYGLVHGVEGIGHGAGEVDIENLVSGREVLLEVLDVLFLGDGAGGGQNAATEPVIEGMRVEGLEINVRIGGPGLDAVRHGDEAVPVFGRQ